jgi:DNA mismatch repair protein MutL
MHSIQRLSSLTINQIAAGEVIENPACVVKELIENSVDAGSSHILIEILAGGFQLIRISDDGTGMNRDDALLSLERHTTSKMILPEDLLSLTTMGFRGEALASIASISKLTLLTSQGKSDAIRIEVEGGEILSVTPAARTQGTSLEVRSLFYNVPARKKFQKSAAASGAEITKIVTQLSLSHPSVGFTLIQQNKRLFCAEPGPGKDPLPLIKQRATQLLASEFVPSCKELLFKEGPYAGWGLVSEPAYARHNRSGQHLFVNNRPVACPAISYAIKDAYGTRLSPDKHPFYVLHLAIAPDLIDVNVHPQKREIRLREEGRLRWVIQSAIHESFSSRPIQNSTRPSEPLLFPSLSTPLPLLLKEEFPSVPTQAPLPIERFIEPVGLWGNYLLISSENLPSGLLKSQEKGIVFVNLPYAEQRIAFESLTTRDTSPSQGLLLPLILSFSLAETARLKTQLSLIENMGIHMHEIGKETFAVTAIPSRLKTEDVKALLSDILAEIQGIQWDRTEESIKLRKLATLVSRNLASSFYTLDKALLIFKQLLTTNDPLHSPQGKATLFHLKESSFETH